MVFGFVIVYTFVLNILMLNDLLLRLMIVIIYNLYSSYFLKIYEQYNFSYIVREFSYIKL